MLDELSDAAVRYDIQITVSGGQLTRERTEGRLRAERSRASAWLAGTGAPEHFDPLPFIEEASGWPAATGWLGSYLALRDLAGLDQEFSSAYVSNPRAGDLVLGAPSRVAEPGTAGRSTFSPGRGSSTRSGPGPTAT